MRTDLNLFIGIMSGTSLDGIDVALVSIENNQTKLISSLETPFTPTLKTELTKLITDQQCHLSKIGELSHNLAIAYSKAVNQLLCKANIESNQIAAIGLHGQTVFHSPNTQPAFSLQLVNASVVAEMTGICCIHNFRETPHTSAASRAATNFWMASWVGSRTFPPMCPHFMKACVINLRYLMKTT